MTDCVTKFTLVAEQNDFVWGNYFQEEIKLIPEKSQFVKALKLMKIRKIETVYCLLKQVMVFVCIWHSLYGYNTTKLLDLNPKQGTGKPIGKTHYFNIPITISNSSRLEINMMSGNGGNNWDSWLYRKWNDHGVGN